MPLLVLVNGPPASGKSTIAARLTDTRPLALALDLDAAALVARSGDTDAVGAMYDRYAELLGTRPRAHRVEVRRGDVEGTVTAIEVLLT